MDFRPKDLLLQAVLSEPSLIAFAGYDPDDYATVDSAIESDNKVVSTVGLIIERHSDKYSMRDIYTEVVNHL